MYPTSPRVLCIGSDPHLLKSREQILAKRYEVTTVSNLQDLAEIIALKSFSLVLICHSLSQSECQAAIDISKVQWPDAKLLVMCSDFSCYEFPGPDITVRAMDGPGVLLRRISGLLASSL